MRSKEIWRVAAKRADFREIGRKFGVDPVIARILRNRDITDEKDIWKYLHGTAKDMYSPWLMHDIDKAVKVILASISAGEKIRVISDYDIDGVMSGYIMGTALTRLGANADVEIPERVSDGYGLNVRMIDKAFADGVKLIITCDNGISAANEIAHAREIGMKVVVTDHHEIPVVTDGDTPMEAPPEADAVINPHLKACDYPQEDICGAVVAYKLAEALFESAGVKIDMVDTYIEFAAFATVGDVMPLVDENRIIVKEGLKRIGFTKNTGLAALIAACRIDPLKIDEYRLGYVLGPCINACGRLSSAKQALDLLMEENPAAAKDKAEAIVELNEKRKELSMEGEKLAEEMVSGSILNSDKVLVVKVPNIHESLTGIIAGRLKEFYNKPAFVLTEAEDGVLKGSGRSTPAYSMYEELCKVEDLLERFGGHPSAAGISIKEENLDEFRRRLNENSRLTLNDTLKKVVIDVPMPMSYVTDSLVSQIEALAPYGPGNARPVFAQKDVRVMYPKALGAKRNVCRMDLVDESGKKYNGIYFGDADEFISDFSNKSVISTLYYPQFNEWNGQKSIQMKIESYQ